jgi:hypothetical protein
MPIRGLEPGASLDVFFAGTGHNLASANDVIVEGYQQTRPGGRQEKYFIDGVGATRDNAYERSRLAPRQASGSGTLERIVDAQRVIWSFVERMYADSAAHRPAGRYVVRHLGRYQPEKGFGANRMAHRVPLSSVPGDAVGLGGPGGFGRDAKAISHRIAINAHHYDLSRRAWSSPGGRSLGAPRGVSLDSPPAIDYTPGHPSAGRRTSPPAGFPSHDIETIFRNVTRCSASRVRLASPLPGFWGHRP